MTQLELFPETVGDYTNDGLPDGWVWAALEEICHVERGITFPASAKAEQLVDGHIVCLRTSNVQDEVDWFDLIYVPFSYVPNESKFLRNNDILISMANSRELVGKTSFVYQVPYQCTFGGFISAIRSVDGIDAKFLFYYLRESGVREWLRQASSQTVNIANLSLGRIAPLPVPIAPLAEQQRIVEAIESLFTQLDAGVGALKRLRANLRRYKAAVLKAACEGKLVPQNPDDEPASVLLERILAARRTKWESEQRAKGKDPRKLKYDEPAAPDTTDLPELPGGWAWATTEQLSAVEKYSMAIGPFGSNLMVKDYRPEGIPLIFVKEIRSGVFDRPGLPHVSLEKAEELRSHHVHPGDLVITKMGEPPGDVAIFPDHIPLAVATSDCIKWTLSKYLNSRRYFMYAITFPTVKTQILKITRGVAQQKMSLERFKGLSIPVPPLSEQNAIVREIDQIMSNIDEIDEVITTNLHRAERLRQAILKQAFEGKLVPQDPNDEPASVLLERIKQGRENQPRKKMK